MVQIYIKIDENQNPDKITEWSIIELQGDLEVRNGDSLTNKFLGDLHFDKDGVPIMILGHHTLYGKVVSLDKPFLLVRKHRKKVENILADEIKGKEFDIDDQNPEFQESKFITEYLVHAVIKKKLLFNKRPRPIVF